MLSTILSPFLCLIFALGFTTALNCTSNSQDLDYEPFPKNVTPPFFHTRMEISLSHRNETYFVDERYDGEKERGTFTLLGNEYDWESYWDKPKNEIDHVYLDGCWSYNWTQQRFDRYRCRFPPNESSLKLIGDACSATVVLDLVYKNKTKNARYLGQKTVRNIPVKGWRICKNDTAMDYWFSVQGWTHTSGNGPVPVLVEARPQNAPSLKEGIIHSYTFLDFYFRENDFSVQREMWCLGAVRPPQLPKLPRRFDVSLEYLFGDSDLIWATREYYDLDKQLYRVDTDHHPKAIKGTGPGAHIRDMQSKTMTYYDRTTGSCQKEKLSSMQPTLVEANDQYMIFAPFGKLALFEDPDARPFYQGRAVSRGIQCDVWQQKRINWPEKAMEIAIWRWYFTRADWRQNLETQPVPVRLEIEGNITINATEKVEYELSLNFYSFESRYPVKNPFDLSSLCPKEPTPQKSRLSSGAVAGVAIACIVCGSLLGALVVYLVFKKFVLARMGPQPQKFP